MPAPLVRALGIQKQAAAQVNVELGAIDAKIGQAIVDAADEVIDGTLTTSSRWWSGRPAPAPRPT